VSGGYQVDPEALKLAAEGINGAISELKSLGIEESGEVGRGFSNVELTGMQLGNAGLRGDFDAFCERWSWGVRTLVQDGNEIAKRLGLSAGIYYDQEQYTEGTLKDVVNAATGNPYRSAMSRCRGRGNAAQVRERPVPVAEGCERPGARIRYQLLAECGGGERPAGRP
jgi:hypothetical protein